MGSQRTKVVALLILGVAVVWGCESSDVLAPTGTQVIIEANPATVIINIQSGQTQAQSAITAQLFDSTGAYPLSGIDVTFTTSSGVLDSSNNTCGTNGTCTISGGACSATVPCPPVAARTIRTDGNGIARDTLTLRLQDDPSATVTLRSATVTGSVTVSKVLLDGTPVARIVANPADNQLVDEVVIFDGRQSTDPAGAGISCYQWTIDSTDNGSDEVVQGRTDSLVSRRYSVEQNLSVTLRVSDREDADTFCISGGTPADPSFFSANSDFINYDIVCDLTGPTVSVSTVGSNPFVLNAGTVTVSLTSNATDGESSIASYSWTCRASDTSPQTTSSASCTYTAAGSYVVTLVVTNSCGLTTTRTVNITVANATP